MISVTSISYFQEQDSTTTSYYVETDHLGSICKIYDDAGSKQYDATYDAWGKQTVNYNTLGLTRGYCAHEHWNQFGLIDMNGRFYDPVVGRFLSPDPYVQSPTNPQNYNRYSYCLNNPLKYNDPSGEFWHIIIGAAIGGVVNWATHGHEFSWEGFGYFNIGALAGAASAAVGGGMSSAIAGGSFWAGAGGTAVAASATSSFGSGAAIGAVSGAFAGTITEAGNSWMGGASFGQGVWKGFVGGNIGGLTGGVMGGLAGGITACNNNCNFWDGKPNTLLDEIDYNLPFCPNEGSNDCFVKSAEAIESKFAENPRTSTQLRTSIGKTKNELVSVEDMQNKAGYRFTTTKDRCQAFEKLKNGKLSFHATDWGDGTGHMTAVNKMQMWQRANGKLYFRLFTMDSAKGQYSRTLINRFYFVEAISRNF